MRRISLTSALICSLLAHATNYYVSPSGNDGNNGTSQATAWKTIARVNQAYTFLPGDKILFERGGVFRGELNLATSGSQSQPVTVGAYGTGAMPVIKGSEVVTNWSLHQGNIWRASVTSGKVDQLYLGGQRMTPARYPNT
ncbi:MAG: hypothetical protein KDC01_05735, partial [Flavobacteriales bacterium]|nr:hypothetical protein [Flavobacteriales bacterium]